MRHSSSLTLAALLMVSLSGCGYNAIQTKDETVTQAASQIRVQLERRADLIPNLVETVRGVAAQETTVFTAVADARSRLSGAIQGGDLGQMAEAYQASNAPLGRLIAIAEAYPDLKSSASFTQLMDQLEGTENRVAVARTDYNAAVADFNTYIRKFPYNLTAKIFGLGTPRVYFELEDKAAEEVPAVQF